ncbi:MAG: hypothetical protein B7Y39_01570 [Bdellovibrio sp. 28-41-41]|nr:MAG: hypothetical protein B7Y39_01570 [Bdellovibrio sp. 28-41-41]
MKTSSLATLLIVTTLVVSTYAQTFTLKSFLVKTLEKSRVIEVENANLKKLDDTVDGQRSGFLPDVNATVQYTTVGNQQSQTPIYNQTINGTSTKINLSQNLFNGLKDLNNLEAANHSRDAQVYKLQETRKSETESALSLFFKLLQYQKDIENQKQEILLYEKNLTDLKTRVQSGSARQNEVINLEATIANSRIDLATSENSLKLAQAQAAAVLRDEDSNAVSVSLKKFSFSFEQTKSLVAKMDTNTRAELKSLSATVQSKENNIRVQKGSYSPSLDLSGSYLVNSSDTNTNQNTYTAGVVLTIPFPVSVKKSSELSKARAEKAIAEIELEKKKDDLQKERAQLIQNLQNNVKQIELLKNAKALNKSNVDSLGRDHRSGLASYSDVLNASITYQKTLQKYDRAVLDFELNCYHALLWSSDVESIISGIED